MKSHVALAACQDSHTAKEVKVKEGSGEVLNRMLLFAF